MMLPSLKRCPKCGETKTSDGFYRDKRYVLQAYCIPCNKATCAAYYKANREVIRANDARRYASSPQRARARRYGMTEAELNTLLDTFDGKCWMPTCLKPATDIDHDHNSKVVRGALCHGHNDGFGKLGDSVEGLIEALQYLLAAEERAA